MTGESNEDAGSPAANTTGSTAGSSGVAMVSLGAALVVGAWLLFELIATEYFVTTVAVVIAALIIGLPRLAPGALAEIAPPPVFARVGGYALAIVGVVELLEDLRFDNFDGFISVVGGLVAYAGYVLAFVGARAIRS